MYINRVLLHENNLQTRKTLPNFKGSLRKPVLNYNNITNSSISKTKKFVHNAISFLKKILKPNKKIKQIQEVNAPIKNTKQEEANIRKILNIPENGMIIRNGYEEHYKNGKIVKKILCPEAYAEHTRLVDTRVEYLYNGDELKEIHKYDTINGKEIMTERAYTNLGDLSVSIIRDL